VKVARVDWLDACLDLDERPSLLAEMLNTTARPHSKKRRFFQNRCFATLALRLPLFCCK